MCCDFASFVIVRKKRSDLNHLDYQHGPLLFFSPLPVFGRTVADDHAGAGAHREMLLHTSYEECKTFQAEHLAVMEARAQEKGATLHVDTQNGCDRITARGLIK